MTLRWRRLGLRLLGLVAAAVLGLYLLLPALIQRQIKLALADAGLPGAQLDVSRPGLGSLKLTDITLADGRLRIPAIDITYDIASLRQLRVQTITVRDALLQLTVREDGSIDWGPLADLGQDDSANPDAPLPFDVLQLTSAKIELHQPTLRHWIDLSLSLRGDELRVDHLAIASIDHGSATIQPFATSLAEPVLPLQLTLHEARLGPLLGLTAAATGEGTVTGDLSLRLKAYRPYRAIIDGGSLHASPGTVLTFATREPLEKLLAVNPQQAPRTATDDTKHQLVEALQDFKYRTLAITFVPKDGDVITRIQIDGKARGDNPTTVGPLTLNIGRINDLINTPVVDATVELPAWLEHVIERLVTRSAGEKP